jgi:phosphatidate phosphatase PAH1
VESVHVEVPFSIFLLEQNAKLVLTDIDGTITESNIKGLVFPQFGIDAHQVSCIDLKS